MEQEIQKKGEVILYHPSETIKLEVRLEKETVWLSVEQMSLLFARDRSVIGKHIRKIFEEGELDRNEVWAKFAHTTLHGSVVGLTQTTMLDYFNLDVVISVGYRVKSIQGTLFRKWANKILKEYLIKGYVVNPQLPFIQRQIDDRFIALQENTDKRFLLLEQKVEHQQEQIDLYIKTNEEPKELLFGNGCVFDAWNYISDLVRSAKREIVLIDNYVDDTVLAILSKREKGVKATVHSRYRAKLIADLEKYNKQFPDAEIDFIQFSDKNHDRFLIIDDDVYMLGNSVKDFGNAWGVVIRMEMSKGDILAMVERR